MTDSTYSTASQARRRPQATYGVGGGRPAMAAAASTVASALLLMVSVVSVAVVLMPAPAASAAVPRRVLHQAPQADPGGGQLQPVFSRTIKRADLVPGRPVPAGTLAQLAAGASGTSTQAATSSASTTAPLTVDEDAGLPVDPVLSRGPRRNSTAQVNNGNWQVSRKPSDPKLIQPFKTGTTPLIKGTTVAYARRGMNQADAVVADNGGNSFKFPVDAFSPALLVGNGFLVEATGSSLVRVCNATTGDQITAPVSINTFLGFRSVDQVFPVPTGGFDSPPLTYGQPQGLFDHDTGRFFLSWNIQEYTPLRFDFGFGLTDFSDLANTSVVTAVSATSDPTGAWNIYYTAIQNDGAYGTPDHGGPHWIGEWPRTHLMGNDANGIYYAAEEWTDSEPVASPFRDQEFSVFKGVNIYAMDKRQLAKGAPEVLVTQFFINSTSGFQSSGVIPQRLQARSQPPAASAGAPAPPSTMHFFSTVGNYLQPDVRNAPLPGTASEVILYSLTDTSTLSSATPALTLHIDYVYVGPYDLLYPPIVNQKPGLGPRSLLPTLRKPARPATAMQYLLSFDSRPTSFVLSPKDGSLWGAFVVSAATTCDPAVPLFVGGTQVCGGPGQATNATAKAGVFVVSINPKSKNTIRASVVSVPNNNILAPAIALSPKGRGTVGAISVSLTGVDFYPSHAVMTFDDDSISPLTIVNPGLAVAEIFGFTSFINPVGPVPRRVEGGQWSWYPGTAVDESGNLYLGQEYIPFPACSGEVSFAENTVAFGPTNDGSVAATVRTYLRCNGTRTRFSNSGASIIKLLVA